MKNKIVITISDTYGSKSYLFHQFIKKFFKYLVLSVLVFIIFAFILISVLGFEVKQAKEKRDSLAGELTTLNQKNQNLEKEIEEKYLNLEAVKDKVSAIEKMIGFETDSSSSTYDRVDSVQITAIKRNYLLSNIPNGTPINYIRVTSKYGYRTHPITGKKDLHRGIDLKAKKGTEVYSTADGVVESTRYDQKGYGKMVTIIHNFGFKTIYAHLDQIKVKAGDYIKKGDLIALSGNTGISSGPHLHYEVKYFYNTINPRYFMDWNYQNFNEIFKEVKKVKWASLINLTNRKLNQLEQQLSQQEPQ